MSSEKSLPSPPAGYPAAWLRVPRVHHELSAKAFWRARDAERASGRPIDWAIDAGLHADRLGLAFAGGYASALHALVPGLDEGALAALCATEERGNHPRSIETRLSVRPGGFALTGSKNFVTFGPNADVLLVFAVRGEREDGRPDLCLVRVPPDAPGVALDIGPLTPFVPEVPHATLRLDQVLVAASQVLPGDGYAEYVKPFRTVEDVHVFAAVLSYLLSVGLRANWPAADREDLVSLLVAARALATLDPTEPATHVALAGWLRAGQRVVAATEPHWQGVEAAERDRWYRDRALLTVAERVREARRTSAWARIETTRGS